MELDKEISTKQMVESFREKESAKAEICSVILRVENPAFLPNSKPWETKLMGKSMLDWVKNAVYDTDIRYADIKLNGEFLDIAKNVTNPSSKYTVVLFCDTPLFQRKTFLEIMQYFKLKQLSALRLTRGFVFETKYLLNIDKLLNPQIEYFEEEDFMTCLDYKQTAMIEEILRNRILTYFMKSGVKIDDPSTTYIDADAQIAPGTVIEPFNQIKGQSIFESGVILKSGNILTDCVICQNSNIKSSHISKSFVGKDVVINENCVISNNAKICDGAVIPPFCNIDGVVVNRDDRLVSFCTYKSEEK